MIQKRTSIDLSIVLPCYNEAGNIPSIIDAFYKALPKSIQTEIILVNNGSTDNTKAVLKKSLSRFQKGPFKVINIPKNKGYGHGILSGLDAASGQVLSMTHADMQTPPEDVFKAYKTLLSENKANTLIKGCRQNRAKLESFFTAGMQWVVLVALKIKLHDINAQPKLFHRSFYETHIQGKAPYDFSLDLFILYQAKKWGHIVEIPVYFKKRLAGEAKGGGSFKTRLKLIQRTFSYIWELKSSIALKQKNEQR